MRCMQSILLLSGMPRKIKIFYILRELITSRLILDMTQRHNQDGDLNVISINLFEYHYSSMVKVSGLRTVYSGFKSAWSFCSYSLNQILDNPTSPNITYQYFSPRWLTNFFCIMLSFITNRFLLIWATISECS